MYTFIVLGIVPGTNIQVSFELWRFVVLEFFGSVIVCWVILKFYDRLRSSSDYLQPVRAVIHATQLHQRVRSTAHTAEALLASTFAGR